MTKWFGSKNQYFFVSTNIFFPCITNVFKRRFLQLNEKKNYKNVLKLVCLCFTHLCSLIVMWGPLEKKFPLQSRSKEPNSFEHHFLHFFAHVTKKLLMFYVDHIDWLTLHPFWAFFVLKCRFLFHGPAISVGLDG